MSVPEPAPPTRPAFLVAPDPHDLYEPAPSTAPASVVHPSWGINVAPLPVEEPAPPSGATAVRRGAHADPAETDDETYAEPRHLGATPVVLISAMICLTFVVLIVSLFDDARAGAVLAGVSVAVGSGMAYIFRDRWR